MRAAAAVEELLEQRLNAVAQRLRTALIANLGRQRGDEAYSEALLYAWTHAEKVVAIDALVPYLFTVGRSRARHRSRFDPLLPAAPPAELPTVEPKLDIVLRSLSARQRTAVILVVGWSWSYAEVAELLDISKSSVQEHVRRALVRLRSELVEVE